MDKNGWACLDSLQRMSGHIVSQCYLTFQDGERKASWFTVFLLDKFLIILENRCYLLGVSVDISVKFHKKQDFMEHGPGKWKLRLISCEIAGKLIRGAGLIGKPFCFQGRRGNQTGGGKNQVATDNIIALRQNG